MYRECAMRQFKTVEGADGSYELPSVAVQRTACRIMDGTVYVRK